MSAAPVLALQDPQLARLNELLAFVAERSPFQRARLHGLPLGSWEDLRGLPATSKDELLADQAAHPPYGTNLTCPPEACTHVHQTSGTTGATLRVLSSAQDWAWWRRCFAFVLEAAGVGPGDRVALAYSFGPYVLFWAGYEGVAERGALALPLGGMDSLQRLLAIREYAATVLLCTPTYALHLARVACENRALDALESVRTIVCAGEPGASIPSTRERIESAWGARVLDHAGLTEVGAFTYPCAAAGGLHLRSD